MCCAIIWGTLLIIFGVSLLINVIFGIHLPLGRIFLGLLLLYFGIQIITGYSKKQSWACGAYCRQSSSTCNTCCGKSDIKVDAQTLNTDSTPLEYSTVFGSACIDLTDLSLDALRNKGATTFISINTVFGKTELKLNKNVPVQIIGKCSFGKTSFPDNTMITFGTHTYLSHGQSEAPLVIIQTNTVFGDLEIESK